MDKKNLEAYLKDILENIEQVIEANDENTIEDLKSYIHVSKDLIKFQLNSSEDNEATEKAYKKIKEAEIKVEKLSLTSHKVQSSFVLKDLMDSFIQSFKELLQT